MAKAPATKTTAKAPATKATAKAPATKTTAKAPATKATAKAPATKTTAKAPATKTTAKAPATKTTAKAPATPSVTPEPPNFNPDVEAAAERFKQTSERVLELSEKNGLIWLEVFEKVLDGMLKLEEDTAKDLGPDWIEKLVSMQAGFIRDTSQAYLGALKDRLK